MNGEVVSCQPPSTLNYGHPTLPKRTRWRCACGVTWVAHPTYWSVAGWRTRALACRRHMRWLDNLRRHEAAQAALTDADKAWLTAMTTGRES